jgi:hypothetical protein
MTNIDNAVTVSKCDLQSLANAHMSIGTDLVRAINPIETDLTAEQVGQLRDITARLAALNTQVLHPSG